MLNRRALLQRIVGVGAAGAAGAVAGGECIPPKVTPKKDQTFVMMDANVLCNNSVWLFHWSMHLGKAFVDEFFCGEKIFEVEWYEDVLRLVEHGCRPDGMRRFLVTDMIPKPDYGKWPRELGSWEYVAARLVRNRFTCNSIWPLEMFNGLYSDDGRELASLQLVEFASQFALEGHTPRQLGQTFNIHCGPTAL